MALMLQSALDTPQQPQQGGIDPTLLAQIMGLGSVDQRHRLLQQQIDMGGQTAQGSQVDYSHGKGTPLLLSGLANLLSAGVGGYQQGKAQGGMRGLIDEQNAGRTAAAGSMLSAAPPDLRSVLMASDANMPQAASDAQEAIRGQRSSGLMGLLSGDPQLAGAGKSLYGEAEKGQATMLGMPQERIGLAEGQQKVAAGERLAASETDPATTTLRRALAKKYAPDQAESIDTAPGGALNTVLPNLEKFAATKETADARREAAKESAAARADVARIMAAGGRDRAIITTTGQAPGAPGQPVDPAALEAIPPAGKLADNYRKLADGFKKDMDAASASSRSAFGQTANVVFRGARNLAILNQKNADGSQRQLTLPEWQEVTGGLISMQTGGAPTQEMMKEGLPHDVEGSAAGIMSWLTSNPHAPDRQAWIDRFTSNVNREEETAKKFQRDTQMQRVPSHSQFFSQYPNRAKLAAGGYGIEPSIIDQVRAGSFKPDAPASVPAAGGATHYSYSADRKQRIPVDASGKPMGPVEPVP